jgi:hypothetical protein
MKIMMRLLKLRLGLFGGELGNEISCFKVVSLANRKTNDSSADFRSYRCWPSPTPSSSKNLPGLKKEKIPPMLVLTSRYLLTAITMLLHKNIKPL